LRGAGRPATRSVGGRVSGPGDSASKHPLRWEPTRSDHAEGHGTGSQNVRMDPLLPPGSQSSARLHMLHAREPGDLGGASPPLVGGWQSREGRTAIRGVCPEESDEGVVPKKSAKTWVTPVESMEERPEAKGNLLQETRAGHCAGNARPTHGSRSGGARRKGSPRTHHPRTFSSCAAPLTRGGSPVWEIRSPGSVRGAARVDR